MLKDALGDAFHARGNGLVDPSNEQLDGLLELLDDFVGNAGDRDLGQGLDEGLEPGVAHEEVEVRLRDNLELHPWNFIECGLERLCHAGEQFTILMSARA